MICPFSTRRLSSTHWFRPPIPTWSVIFRHVVSTPLLGHVVSLPLIGSFFPPRQDLSFLDTSSLLHSLVPSSHPDKVCHFWTRRLSSTHWFRFPTTTRSVIFRHVVSPPLIGSVFPPRQGLSFFDTSSLLHSLDPSCHHDKVCHFPPRQKRC